MVLDPFQRPRRRSAAARTFGRLTAIIATAALIAFPSQAAATTVPPAPGAVTPAAADGCGARPLDVIIVIDRSTSMDSESRLVNAKKAAKDLVNSLDDNGGVGGSGLHHVGLTSFAGSSALVDVHLGTASAATVDNAIDHLDASGNTPTKHGMAAAAGDMSAPSVRDGLDVNRVIIFLSDGEPNPSSETPNASEISGFKGSTDEVFTIALGISGTGVGGVDPTFMRSLAKPMDDDHAFWAKTAAGLPDIFDLIYHTIACTPDIAVHKSASTTDLPFGGGDVTYTYKVTNPGNVALSSVGLTDNKCSPVSDPTGDSNSNKKLDVGETWTYTCTATLTETTKNVATATGSYRDTRVEAKDDVTVKVAEPKVAIAVEKSASTTDLPFGGGDVTYTYEVTNPGQVALSSVSVVDDKCDAPAYASGDSNSNEKVDVGETWTYTCTATLTETTKNVATASGSYGDKTVEAKDDVTVKVAEPKVGIDVEKSASKTDLPVGGGAVTYTYKVTNAGQAPLANVAVVDDKCSSVTFVDGDANSNEKLDVGETWTYTCSATLTETTTNTATASGSYGDQAVEAKDDATVTVALPPLTPAIHVEKSASTTDLPSDGGDVTYTYKVTNTGTVPLSNVGLSDDKCSPVTFVSGDANSNEMLDLTETWTYTCDASLTETTTNVATATGYYGETKVEAKDDVTVSVAEPEITAKPTPSGTVAAETGAPETTLPPTDAVSGGSTGPGSLPLILGLLAAIALVASVLPAGLRRRMR